MRVDVSTQAMHEFRLAAHGPGQSSPLDGFIVAVGCVYSRLTRSSRNPTNLMRFLAFAGGLDRIGMADSHSGGLECILKRFYESFSCDVLQRDVLTGMQLGLPPQQFSVRNASSSPIAE